MAIALAALHGVPLVPADDVVTGLRAMTTTQQQPELHYWDAHPEAGEWPPARIAQLHLSVAEVLRPAFEAIVREHAENLDPVTLEGDYLLPDFAQHPGVRAVVLAEPDTARLVANYAAREPGPGEQRLRAEVSRLVGAELTRRASAADVPVVAAVPWRDAADRVAAALAMATRP
ncbi:hypothetical protein GCM10009682_03570 [Luedemannella flava]|uniref:Uncharacterized protein n=1 Tax=Luedemannella flava TaxID=349316 RepID=A0ABN2LDU4_9ACTN